MTYVLYIDGVLFDEYYTLFDLVSALGDLGLSIEAEHEQINNDEHTVKVYCTHIQCNLFYRLLNPHDKS